MRKIAFLALVVIVGACALSFLQLPHQAAATPTAPWILTYDTSDNLQQSFNLGEAVRVKSYADVQYYIIVVKPGNLPGFSIGPISGGSVYTDDRSDLSNVAGDWHLVLFDTTAEFAIGYFHVIPFAPLGVVGILGACFLVAGLKLRKKK
jgi:hypothetical protein